MDGAPERRRSKGDPPDVGRDSDGLKPRSSTAPDRLTTWPTAVGVAAERALDALPRPLVRALAPYPEESWTVGPSALQDAVRRLVRTTVVVAASSAVLLAVTHLANLALTGLDLYALNADADGSIWGWAGVVTEFGAAMGAAALAVQSRDRARELWVLAVLVAFWSFDDFTMLHERLSRVAEPLPIDHAGRLVWPLLLLPVMVAVGVLLCRVVRGAEPSVRGCVLGGLSALVAAVVLEVTSPLVLALSDSDYASWSYNVAVAVEEGLEMGGWALIAGGLLAAALDRAWRGQTQPIAPRDGR